MHANLTNNGDGKEGEKIIYRELSYVINGILFSIHNAIGRFGREKQYGDALEMELKSKGVIYEREKPISLEKVENERTNIADFVIADKILIELKAKPFITKEDYMQTQRYLQASGYKLGLLVNFRNKFLKPIRIIRVNS